jgi:uncharacterized protein (DUF1786 family)
MSANGISTLVSKQLKQEAKLTIAEAKRQGKNVAIDGTITGAGNSAQPFYRTLNTANINIVPTKYSGNTITDNVLDGNVLISGRPYT